MSAQVRVTTSSHGEDEGWAIGGTEEEYESELAQVAQCVCSRKDHSLCVCLCVCV